MKNLSKNFILLLFMIIIIFLTATLVIVSKSVIDIFSYNSKQIEKNSAPKKEPGIYLYGTEYDKNISELILSDGLVDKNIVYVLGDFPKLEKVIIKNQILPINIQIALEK